MSEPLLDARGVEIRAGDIAIYGFGVSRSVAMAEGVVLEAEVDLDGYKRPGSVSLTPTGRVRIRVIRRSYSQGEELVVHLMPDRFVVLKRGEWAVDGVTQSMRSFLPASPLPTQDEEARKKIQRMIDMYQEDIDATQPNSDLRAYAVKRIAYYRKRLEALGG